MRRDNVRELARCSCMDMSMGWLCWGLPPRQMRRMPSAPALTMLALSAVPWMQVTCGKTPAQLADNC